MNIFVLDNDPILAAQYLDDKRVVKMTLETAQILSTVSHKLGIKAPYKPTHINHPSVLWAEESIDNYWWLFSHGMGLCQEYTRRYNKIHACEEVYFWLENYGGKPKKLGLTPIPQCMPDKYKITNNPVQAYRRYFIGEKMKNATWKEPSSPPEWI